MIALSGLTMIVSRQVMGSMALRVLLLTSHQPLLSPTVWLYKAKRYGASLQLPCPSNGRRLRRYRPTKGGDCIDAGGQMHSRGGKCVSAHTPTR